MVPCDHIIQQQQLKTIRFKSPSKMAGPLSKVRVLELAGLAPVPMAGMILADFGASVIRIDKMEQGFAEDSLARGKKSIMVDLKNKKGIDVVKRLSKNADVLMDPFRPNVMEKLGLGPDTLLKENEKLIYARLTGRSLQRVLKYDLLRYFLSIW